MSLTTTRLTLNFDIGINLKFLLKKMIKKYYIKEKEKVNNKK